MKTPQVPAMPGMTPLGIKSKKAVPLWKGAEALIQRAEQLSGGDVELAMAMLLHAAEALHASKK